MALVKNVQKEKEVEKKDIESEVVSALNAVGENDKPFLRQDEKGDLAILGDPKKVEKIVNDTIYDLVFILPKSEFNTSDFSKSDISYENKDYFNVKAQAKQEEITPNNRDFFSKIAVTLMMTFFRQKKDKNGNPTNDYDLVEGSDLLQTTFEFFRQEYLVENTKMFVGKMLGLDDKLIPYIDGDVLIELAVSLIVSNPTLINEAFYQGKR